MENPGKLVGMLRMAGRASGPLGWQGSKLYLPQQLLHPQFSPNLVSI